MSLTDKQRQKEIDGRKRDTHTQMDKKRDTHTDGLEKRQTHRYKDSVINIKKYQHDTQIKSLIYDFIR